jgi:AraC-like DNA-binding protein
MPAVNARQRLKTSALALRRLPDGRLGLRRSIVVVPGEGVGQVTAGATGALVLLRLRSGELRIRRADGDLPVPRGASVLIVPPLGLVTFVSGERPARLTYERFPLDGDAPDVEQATLVCAEPRSQATVARYRAAYKERPRGVSRRIKEAIDRAGDERLAAIAARLRLQASHLARYFREDYGVTPNEYRHGLRATAAMAQLMRGASATHAAGLSRCRHRSHVSNLIASIYGLRPSQIAAAHARFVQDGR